MEEIRVDPVGLAHELVDGVRVLGAGGGGQEGDGPDGQVVVGDAKVGAVGVVYRVHVEAGMGEKM